MKTNLKQVAAGVVTSALAFPALATGPAAPDLSGLTPDMGTVLTAIAAVAVVLIGVNLAIKGFRIVRSLIGR